MRFRELRSPDDVIALVGEIGFLPFFACSLDGFSLQDCCPASLWFSEDEDGPWEWKGAIARSGQCIYGKLLAGRAGFVSRAWFPDLANFRRSGYDFDARYDDGLASRKDRDVFHAVQSHGSLVSRELKTLCHGNEDRGFDRVVTRLQMQTYLCISDFVYQQDRYGRAYGWGLARYSTPEALLGYDTVTSAYARSPEESRARILAHLKHILPGEDERAILRLIG